MWEEKLMKAFVRRSLASGAGLALAVCGGAWAAAQTQSSATQNQATPAQSQQNPAAQTNTPNTNANPGAQTQQQNPQNTTPQSTPQQNNPNSPATDAGATQQPQTRTLQMVQAKAELQKGLDAKKAKQGEPVTAKLSDDVQVPNAQTLPKNTVLEGHVDQTQVSQDKHGTSSVTVTFDKAKLKTGQELPIKATVLAIAQPTYNTGQAGAPGSAPVSGPPMAGGGAPGGGGAPSGGGSPSGAAPSSMPSQQVPSATEPGTGTQANGAQASGVQVKSDIHQPTSATFVQQGKDVHVSGGTQMEVALTIIPPGTHLQ
jgi:hypothetical protein